MIINADGLILGRMAAIAAKALLRGEKVDILNAENAIITGKKKNIIAKYAARRAVKAKATPEHSPHWPRRPDLLVRRIVRGMLPFDKPKGRKAFKNLRVYFGIPEEFKGKENEFEKIEKKPTKIKKMKIIDLCRELGWHA